MLPGLHFGLVSWVTVRWTTFLGPIQPFMVQNQLRPASQTQPPSFRLHSAAWMSSFFAGRTASVYAGNNEIQFLSKHTLRLRCKPVLSRVSDWLQIDAHSFRSLNHFFLLFAVNLAAPHKEKFVQLFTSSVQVEFPRGLFSEVVNQHVTKHKLSAV